MEGIRIYAVLKTERVTCKTVELFGTLYANEESAKTRALELYRMEKNPEKYDYRVEIYTLKN